MLTDNEKRAAKAIVGLPPGVTPAPPVPDVMADVLGVGRETDAPQVTDIIAGQPVVDVADAVPEPIQETPGAAAARKWASLQLHAVLFAVIDGRLQAEEQRVDVRCSADRIRVYMRSAVPQGGLEFDATESIKTRRQHRVKVIGPRCDAIVRADMRCIHFAVGHAVNKEACARYIFECTRSEAEVAPQGTPTREYYDGKRRP